MIYIDETKKKEIDAKRFKSLTSRQFKLGLLEAGLLDQIDNSIAAIEDDQTRARIQIEYNEAEKFERQSGLVIYMINMLELSAEQVDEMWLHAMTL